MKVLKTPPCAGLSLALVLLAACTGGSPSSRVTAAIELAGAGRSKALDDYVCKKAEDPNAAAIVKEIISGGLVAGGGLRGIETQSEQIEGDHATVVVQIHLKNGTTHRESFPLRREDGKWRIIP